MKKYLEEKYQQLINDMERAYDATIDTLNYHINQLQRTVREQEDELDKLKGGDKLAEEIAKLEEQPQIVLDSCQGCDCPGCDARISELFDQVEALKKENKSLRMSNGHLKSTKAKKTKTYKKNVVCLCKDCKKYFQACRRDAMRCADCKRKHAAELTKKYRAKQ